MNKAEALLRIEELWNDREIDLGEKIMQVSQAFYSVGLDLSHTAQYLRTTDSELGALLALSDLTDEQIERVARIKPPKTTWMILANASEEELDHALTVMEGSIDLAGKFVMMSDEDVYKTMIEISGPTKNERIATLSSEAIAHAAKKAKSFKCLTDRNINFLNSVSKQRKLGKVLTEKQTTYLTDLLDKLVIEGVIKHDSIDGDAEICEAILKALEK